MQREIKFRAWHDKEKKMYQWEELQTMTECLFDKEWIKFTNGILVAMQYTGLKDKNGKEIYESDIIEWIEEPTNRNTFHEICWIEKEGCWGTKDGIWLCNTNMNYKVIGNIYENPELLKGAK